MKVFSYNLKFKRMTIKNLLLDNRNRSNVKLKQI